MKELDFDELDKAVSSLVTQPKTNPKNSASTPGSSVSVPKKKPSQTANVDSQAIAVKVTPGRHTARLGAKAVLSQPARNNFIDVMAVKPKTKAAAKSTSRQGVAIQPLTKEEPAVTTAEKDEPTLSTKEKPEAAESDQELSKKSVTPGKVTSSDEQLPAKELSAKSTEKWPDPLDFHADEADVNSELKKEEAASPFLLDTKVEKRPLGAFSAQLPTAEAAKGQQAAAEKPKLEPEVLVSPDNPTDYPQEASVDNDQPKNEVAAAEVESDVSEKVEKQVRDSALLSISQQYKRQTQELNEVTRSVFDTKEYHQPLIEAKTHGRYGRGRAWLVVLIIIVIAVVAYLAFTYFVQTA